MRHFNIAQWADHVRGVAADDNALAMEEHLATGCNRCNGMVASVRRVVRLARADAEETPPLFAVRSVKALFSLNRPERWSLLPRVPLRLASDSALALVGVRGPEDSTRQAHYESDEYSLDLQLDIPAGAPEGVVVGQLLKRSGEPVSDTAAYLISGGEIAAGCFTGALGDFEMEFGRQEAVELWLLVDGTETLAVTLHQGSA